MKLEKIITIGESQVFRAPELISRKDTQRLSIFLAGTIDNGESENWQEKIIEAGKGLNVDFYSPRREDWDSTLEPTFDNPVFFKQVAWEIDAMEKADSILMNFLPNSKSPITLLELGLFASSGKLKVVCPDEFWRSGNVHFICNKYDIPLFKSIDEIVEF